MKIKKKIANFYNWLKVFVKKTYIVIHYSSGTIDTDENNGEYFARKKSGVRLTCSLMITVLQFPFH